MKLGLLESNASRLSHFENGALVKTFEGFDLNQSKLSAGAMSGDENIRKNL